MENALLAVISSMLRDTRTANVSLTLDEHMAKLPAAYQSQIHKRLMQMPRDASMFEIAAGNNGNGHHAEPKTWADMENEIGPITWHWPGWLPNGMLTIVAAESGTGKSSLILRVAGCFLAGWQWPDGSKFTGDIGKVIWCEAESAQAINLQRAKQWGLPIDKILSPGNPLDDFQLGNQKHMERLREICADPEVKLVILDSLSGSDAKAERDSESAATVKQLAELARDASLPILLSHHLRKRNLFDTGPVTMDRLRGSSAIIQPARCIWGLDAPDINLPESKRLSVVKSNLARFPAPVGLHIDDLGVKFGTAPVEPRQETVTDRAIDLLRSLLAREPRLADEMETERIGAGISPASWQRSKKKLGIISFKKSSAWWWSLPAQEEGEQYHEYLD